jgi:hypothetical protein
MEQTSHLASLVKSSVDTLTSIDALQQSLAKYSKASQVSGLGQEGCRKLIISY